jgi:hypothetical protein
LTTSMPMQGCFETMSTSNRPAIRILESYKQYRGSR